MATTFPERLSMALAKAKARGRDQGVIAGLAEVDEGQLSRWKNGKATPDLDSVAAVVLALGISGHWLLTGDGDMDLPTETEAAILSRLASLEAVAVEIRRRLGGRPSPASGE